MISTFSPRNGEVYVNTHFQHFKKTIEALSLKDKMKHITEKVSQNLVDGIVDNRNKVYQIEEKFLKEMKKPGGQVGRNEFKKDFKTAMQEDDLASKYLKIRDEGFSQEQAVSTGEYTLSQLRARNSERKLSPTKNKKYSGATQKYIRERTREIQDFFGEIQIFLDTIYDIYEKLPSGSGPEIVELLNTMRGRAKFLAQDAKKMRLTADEKKKKNFPKLVRMLRDIANGKITSLSELGNNFHMTMYRSVNETMMELVSASAVAHLFSKGHEKGLASLAKAVEDGGFEHVGPAGMIADSAYGKTDYIFKVGKMKIGFDVKANREIYSTSASRNYIFLEFIENAFKSKLPKEVIKGLGGNSETFINAFSYALVNMYVMDKINKSGIKVPNAAAVDTAFLKENIFHPVQELAVLLGVAHFIDEYLAKFNQENRDQIIIQLGDNIVFLTEFITHIQKITMEIIGGKTTAQDSLGYVNMGSVVKEAGSLSKNPISQTWIKELSEAKTNWLRDRLDYKKTKTFDVTSGTGKFYPFMFNDLKTDYMKKIADSVLSKDWQIQMNFKFDKLK